MAPNDAPADPFVLGLTGPIACGKTTVGDLLLQLGALARIDADKEVHSLMTPGSETTQRVVQEFGDSVLAPDGGVNRSKLGSLVFADPTALARLEGIVHPRVRTAIRQKVEGFRGRRGVVVIDAVKLLQSELLQLCHSVWLVICSPATQMDRLIEDRQMDEESAHRRLKAQPSFDSDRVASVIENSGSREGLRRQVAPHWEALLRTEVTPPA